jgi:hypothetical protein
MLSELAYSMMIVFFHYDGIVNDNNVKFPIPDAEEDVRTVHTGPFVKRKKINCLSVCLCVCVNEIPTCDMML